MEKMTSERYREFLVKQIEWISSTIEEGVNNQTFCMMISELDRLIDRLYELDKQNHS